MGGRDDDIRDYPVTSYCCIPLPPLFYVFQSSPPTCRQRRISHVYQHQHLCEENGYTGWRQCSDVSQIWKGSKTYSFFGLNIKMIGTG